MIDVEKYSFQVVSMLQLEIKGDALLNQCREVYSQIRYNPSILKKIERHSIVANALNIYLCLDTVNDIDIIQRISSISYYLISKAILLNPSNMDLYPDRMYNIIRNKEALGYTIKEALGYKLGENPLNYILGLDSLNKRDSIIMMEMYDFSVGGQELIKFDKLFTKEYLKNVDLIRNGALGKNRSVKEISEKGYTIHNKVFNFLENKLIENEDIFF